MVSSRGVSAAVCLAIGIGCIGSVLGGHGSDVGAVVAVPPAPAGAERAPDAEPPAAPAAVEAEVDVDTSLPTGSIAPGSALHAPNPAAYAEAARGGSSLVVAGAEAINYLAGNTLRREGPGGPQRLTYFASRGLMGEGDERGFTARRWERERPELCEPGPDGATLCRSITILLDGKYEFPGARLGTVTLGAVAAPGGAAPGGAALGSETAALVKGNALHFPEHIPFLDSSVDLAAAPAAVGPAKARGPDAIDALLGRPAAAVGDAGARGRGVVLYAKDNRRLELEPVEGGPDGGRAVRVTVGRWHTAKASLCQTRVIGDAAQSCFRTEALADGGVRLVPTGKAGEPQSLMPLPEAGAREVAQD